MCSSLDVTIKAIHYGWVSALLSPSTFYGRITSVQKTKITERAKNMRVTMVETREGN